MAARGDRAGSIFNADRKAVTGSGPGLAAWWGRRCFSMAEPPYNTYGHVTR